MFDVVSRLNAIERVPPPSTWSAAIDGTNTLVVFPASADPAALAEIISSTLGAIGSATPLAELEPLSLPDATLRSWERQAGPAPARTLPPRDASDGRWFWALTVALLGLETWVGRTGATSERVRA